MMVQWTPFLETRSATSSPFFILNHYLFTLNFLDMLRLEVIGNLGADAEVRSFNGQDFLSFRVAHSEKYTGADGVLHTSTTWVGCTYNGSASRLLPFLKCGVKVFVRGYVTMKIYTSPKTHQQEVGLNVSVRELELCGGSQHSEQQTPSAEVPKSDMPF